MSASQAKDGNNKVLTGKVATQAAENGLRASANSGSGCRLELLDQTGGWMWGELGLFLWQQY